MAQTVFTIDGVEYDNIRVLSLTQTFEVLDNDKSTRTLDGVMHRGIIGTYYNYKLKIKPEMTEEGMRQLSNLWWVVSQPTESHELVVPSDMDGAVHDTRTFQAYITSGSRDMIKYNVNGVDYWKEMELNFISMSPALGA